MYFHFVPRTRFIDQKNQVLPCRAVQFWSRSEHLTITIVLTGYHLFHLRYRLICQQVAAKIICHTRTVGIIDNERPYYALRKMPQYWNFKNLIQQQSVLLETIIKIIKEQCSPTTAPGNLIYNKTFISIEANPFLPNDCHERRIQVKTTNCRSKKIKTLCNDHRKNFYF